MSAVIPLRSPDTLPAGAPALEPHYSPAEIAAAWGLSVDAIRKIFEKEPGVLVIGNAVPRRAKRSYTTLRIPQHILERVHRRMCRV